MTRREWLAAAAASSACSGARDAATEAPMGRYIDAHVHVWTQDTERYPLPPGRDTGQMRPPSFTPEELFAHCRPSGVGRVNLIQMSFYEDDHSYMLWAMKAYPGVFAGTGLLAGVLKAARPADVRMLELAERGVTAFRLLGGARENPGAERWMDDERYDALYRAAAERNLALSFLCNPEDLPEIDRMGERYPSAPVMIDHLARIRPAAPNAGQHTEALVRLARHPRTMLKVGAFYALSAEGSPYTDLLPLVRRTVEAFGPERCMWESDCPYQVQPPHRYDDSVALIRDRADFLSASDRERILGGTAEEFFFRR